MNIIIAPYAKKLHTGQNNAKNYPKYYWEQLIKMLENDGHTITQVAIEGEEHIAKNVVENKSFGELAKIIKDCDFFISVDSFIQHFAWYYNKKGLVIFSKSDPRIFGHELHCNVLKDFEMLRKSQFAFWTMEPYDIDAFPYPEEIYETIKKEFY